MLSFLFNTDIPLVYCLSSSIKLTIMCTCTCKLLLYELCLQLVLSLWCDLVHSFSILAGTMLYRSYGKVYICCHNFHIYSRIIKVKAGQVFIISKDKNYSAISINIQFYVFFHKHKAVYKSCLHEVKASSVALL